MVEHMAMGTPENRFSDNLDPRNQPQRFDLQIELAETSEITELRGTQLRGISVSQGRGGWPR
ncbi:hypothetical protein AB0L44_45445 [Nonomuraea wenchangensis]|uniref:hypothetical protein n=1 Tax=Nonomuraea wenchangensis TaxID=568860 RepID=UPI00342C9172